MLLKTEFVNSCVLFQSTWDRCYWRQSLSIHVCYFSQHGIDATGDKSLSSAPWQGVGHRCSSGNNQMSSHPENNMITRKVMTHNVGKYTCNAGANLIYNIYVNSIISIYSYIYIYMCACFQSIYMYIYFIYSYICVCMYSK